MPVTCKARAKSGVTVFSYKPSANIAAEPAPVHVPRERKPLVVVDEGPLILVETRKDLSQVQLPFERQQPGA